jgi:thiamine-phosphate pyrophosphorylase
MKQRTIFPKHGLYLITPDDSDHDRFLARVLAVLSEHIAILQYRNKLASPKQARLQAASLQTHCRQLNIIFIINDDIALAKALNADGVHLGEHDGDARSAKSWLGLDTIVGVSCYNLLNLAEKAAADGADYIAFGAMYRSNTKPDARQASLELLSQATHLQLPIVAIGGITPDNAKHTIAAGADFLAVIGAVFDAEDPTLEITKFISCF